ncbi:MAG: hypothetical protein CVU84_11980 [Firmicutes bacterium HGW-Firmicutes-1]|jgi:hypothetical protein|nr:MAG: hypothetical protein CVU84_11980 [Firmicutes bacterium HGW-Firmicutes-1]
MKKALFITTNIIAIALIIFGGIGYLSNLIQAINYDNIGHNKYYEQKPLNDQQGFAVDSSGNIYMGTMEFSGIQVYDGNGKFLYGMSFPTGWGGYFDYFIDDKELLHVLLHRSLQEYTIFNGEVVGKTDNINLEERTGIFESKKSNSISRPNGLTYIKSSRKTIDIIENSEFIKQVKLDTPIWPLSVTTFFMINAFGFLMLALLHRRLFKLKGYKKMNGK